MSLALPPVPSFHVRLFLPSNSSFTFEAAAGWGPPTPSPNPPTHSRNSLLTMNITGLFQRCSPKPWIHLTCSTHSILNHQLSCTVSSWFINAKANAKLMWPKQQLQGGRYLIWALRWYLLVFSFIKKNLSRDTCTHFLRRLSCHGDLSLVESCPLALCCFVLPFSFSFHVAICFLCSETLIRSTSIYDF